MPAALRPLVLVLAIVSVVGSMGQTSASSITRAATDTPRVVVHADAVSNNDPYLGSDSWQLKNSRLPDAWSLSSGNPSIVIAVLDSGVDRSHEDLGALVPGRDFVNDDANPVDDNGHGTAVAGIIAAQEGNGKGTAGICPKCRIMPVKVLGADNSGSWSDVAAGVIWATEHGARVINMSFGLSTGSRSIAKAVRYAEDHNVVVVASSGNADSAAPEYPASYPGVVSVGAVDEHGTRYSPSNGNVPSGKWGSNYGSWVDVDAPGCVNSTAPGDNYTYFCGTSASAPFVAGLAGLALSYVPDASAAQVVDAIESTAQKAEAGNSAHGLIDARAALTTLRSLSRKSALAAHTALETNGNAALVSRVQPPGIPTARLFFGDETVAIDQESRAPWAR